MDIQAILGNYDSVSAAPDRLPIPSGTYRCRAVAGELAESRHGTPSYKVTFEVTAGEHAGRRLYRDFWLTAAAAAYSKRDLSKLGITSSEAMRQPIPPGRMCDVQVIRRAGDAGDYNEIKSFEVVEVAETVGHPLAPKDDEYRRIMGV